MALPFIGRRHRLATIAAPGQAMAKKRTLEAQTPGWERCCSSVLFGRPNLNPFCGDHALLNPLPRQRSPISLVFVSFQSWLWKADDRRDCCACSKVKSMKKVTIDSSSMLITISCLRDSLSRFGSSLNWYSLRRAGNTQHTKLLWKYVASFS